MNFSCFHFFLIFSQSYILNAISLLLSFILSFEFVLLFATVVAVVVIVIMFLPTFFYRFYKRQGRALVHSVNLAPVCDD